MKRLVLVVLLLLAGCGSNSGSGGGNGVGETRAKIELASPTRVILTAEKIISLGEIVNNSDFQACHISVSIESFDVSGALIAKDSSHSPQGISVRGCLEPGEKAPFKVGNLHLKTLPASFKETLSGLKGDRLQG